MLNIAMRRSGRKGKAETQPCAMRMADADLGSGSNPMYSL